MKVDKKTHMLTTVTVQNAHAGHDGTNAQFGAESLDTSLEDFDTVQNCPLDTPRADPTW